MSAVTEPYDLLESLGFKITMLSRINERRFEKLLAPLGLSRVTWCVLLAVHQERLVNPSDIASFIGIDRTATSRALKRLESKRLIRRINGRTDKRTTEVTATAAGVALLDTATEAARSNARLFNDKLTRDDRDRLVGLVDCLLQGEIREIAGL